MPKVPNHLLLRTGLTPITGIMRRLLTGYAVQFNRRHRRHGHLFQNRYKSILCQADPYLLELVRYIHLNPLRAKLVADYKSLKGFSYGGHSALMGKCHNDWQNTEYILSLFGRKASEARRLYSEFVEKGVSDGKRPELVGGGLIRMGGGRPQRLGVGRNKRHGGRILNINYSIKLGGACHVYEEKSLNESYHYRCVFIIFSSLCSL